MPPAVKYGDRIGLRYGRLTVVAKSDRTTSKRAYWVCHCDCGGSITTRSDTLTSGKAQGCGCVQREAAAVLGASTRKHNFKGTPVYRSWCHMKGRCYDKNNPRYSHYGERGITVCKRWHEFKNFLADMGEPEPGMTLERVRVNEGYSPDNCIWADALTQNRNRTISVRVVTECGLLPVKEYAKFAGISDDAARARAYKGTVTTVRVGELV